MACDSQRTEGAEVATVFQRDERKRDDDEENGFLVDVPAEEEGCVAAEGDGADELLPFLDGAEEEFDEGDDLEEQG